jgi:2-keto-4-pentenoate hydratase/2-oxohepta-3-ene-1,7-dioic acid hydratase in catechol pathway
MNIVIFGEQRRVGAISGDRIVDLNATDPSLPPTLLAFIEAGDEALQRAAAAIAHPKVTHAANAVKLHAPWPGRRIACVGGNFADHLVGMDRNTRGIADSTIENTLARAREMGHWGFWKVPLEAAGPGDEIPYPQSTQRLDYEGELAIVIGKRGKRIPKDRIAEYVWGVTLLNDYSIRDGRFIQRGISYNLWKNFDGSTAIGPCIVTGELDPANVDVETYVNGERRQRYNTRDMIFSFGEVLEFLSTDITFAPGDLISGGTAAGTAADSSKIRPDKTFPPERFLKPGDTVTVASPQIGSLENRIT